MINGYEGLFGENGKYPYYPSNEEECENLATNSPIKYSLGMTGSQVYRLILTNKFGLDTFSTCDAMVSLYSASVEKIAQYKDSLLTISETQNSLNHIKTALKKNQQERLALAQKLMALQKANMKQEAEKIQTAVLRNIEELKILSGQEDDLAKTLQEATSHSKDLRSEFFTLFNGLKETVGKISNETLDKLINFEQVAPEQEIEQDFVDGCLLPDETKEETRMRNVAKAKYNMAKIENSNILATHEMAIAFVNQFKGYKLDTELEESHIKQSRTSMALKELSTDALVQEDALYDVDEIAIAYKEITDKLIASGFKDIDANSIYNELVGKYQIPVQRQSGLQLFVKNVCRISMQDVDGAFVGPLSKLEKI